MTEQETLYAIALSFVPRMNLLNRKMLFEDLGSATEIFEHRRDLKEIVPNASKATLEALATMDMHLKRAEEEQFPTHHQYGGNQTDYSLRKRYLSGVRKGTQTAMP